MYKNLDIRASARGKGVYLYEVAAMPLSTQALYFHLGMKADDEGFVSNPKKVLRSVNCTEDDLKLLIAKGFVIAFMSGVIVLTHWHIHNSVRKDRRKNTLFQSEKSLLQLDDSKVYSLSVQTDNQLTTVCQPSDNQMTAQGKVSKDKLASYGVDFDEYWHYKNLMREKEENARRESDSVDFATQNFFTGAAQTAFNILSSPVQALEYIGNLGESLTGWISAGTNELSSYQLPNIYNDSVTNISKATTQAITEEIRSNIKGDGDNEFLNYMADLAANTYGGITSGLQSAYTYLVCKALLPPGASEVAVMSIKSCEAANDAYHEVINNGGTVGQAVTYSALAGINEALGESISLENAFTLLDAFGKVKAKGIIVQTLRQALFEATEEVATDFLNEIADVMVNADKSEYWSSVRQYMEEDGLSEEEAKKKAQGDFCIQMLWSAFGGAVGSLPMAGAGAVRYGASKVYNSVKEHADTRRFVNENTSKIADTKGGAESVLQTAKDIIQNGTNNKALSDAVEKAEKSVGTDEYEKNIAFVASEVQKQQLREVGGSHETAVASLARDEIDRLSTGTDEQKSAMASVVAKMATSETDNIYTSLSRSEQKIYQQNTDVIDKAVKSLRSDEGKKQIIDRYAENFERSAKKLHDTAEKAGLIEKADTFDTSDDGKTYVKGNDNPVNVQNIDSVDNGRVTLTLDNGQKVRASKLSFGSADTAGVLGGIAGISQKSTKNMSREVANTIYHLWNTGAYEGKLNDYLSDVYKVYEYTHENAKPGDLSVLSSDHVDMLVRETEKEKSAAEPTIKGQKSKGKVTAEKGINLEAIENDKNNIRSVGVQVVRNLAKATGINFHFFASKKNSKGTWVSQYSQTDRDGNKLSSPNGFYKDGKIYVDINAGINGEGLMLFTVSHELVHFMRDGSKKSFDRLADFLVKNYGTRGTTLKQYIAGEMSKGVSKDVAYEEVVARLCESFLTDIHMSEKVEALYKTDRSLCEKIRDFLRDIGQKIKAAFAGAKPQSELGRIGRDISQKHSEVLDLFIEGIRAASENLAYTESSSGVLNMARDTSYDFSLEKDLDTLDEKALKVYNKRGWAYSLFDDEDMILLREKFDEYYQLKTRNKDNILPDGTMVTDINNKVLLIGGTRNSPVIHGVLLINSDAESYAEIIKDDIYDDTKEFGIHARQCTNYLANCENWYGTKTVRFYGADDYYHIKGREQARAKTPDGWNRFGYVKDYEIGRRIREEAQQSGEVKLQSRDSDYLSAVERGDMETAQRMVDEAAKEAGYGVDASWRMDHKAPNSKDGVRIDQIDRAYNNDGSIYSRNAAYYYGDGRDYDNKAIEAIRKAKDNPDAVVSVYRAVPTQIKDKRIRNGDWVTVDREYAEEHGWRMFDDAYRVIENKVPARHLFTDGNSIHEFGYDNGNAGEVYKNTENNVKLATVTYDDAGNVIPLSERFNTEKKDIRYQDRFEELLADETIDFENTDPVELLSAYIEAHREAINEMQQRERAAAEKKINELKQHYKEQRNKEHERRKKTEFRHRVVKMIDDFNKLLNHPVEGKYVPRQFISQTVDFLND